MRAASSNVHVFRGGITLFPYASSGHSSTITNNEVETLTLFSAKPFNVNDPNLTFKWTGNSSSSRVIISGSRITINDDIFCLPSDIVVSGQEYELTYLPNAKYSCESVVY